MTGPALVAQPDTKLLYMAARHSLRLVKHPKYPMYGAGGQKVGEHPGETLAFKDGRLFIEPGGKVTLEDGREVDSDPVIEWLENHRLNGDLAGGFVAVEPSKPAPTVEELEAIMEAGIVGDEAKLSAIIEAEESGYGREAILRPARSGLSKVREILAKLDGPASEGAPEPVAVDPASANLVQLRELGRPLGLAFRPGTTTEQARAAVLAAMAESDTGAAGSPDVPVDPEFDPAA